MAALIFNCTARPDSKENKEPEIEAVLPSGGNWFLFRLGGLRYAKVPATTQAWGAEAPARQWLAIPSPEGAFRPVQALAATRGYFYLVDGASSRICLYDSSAALISTFPLPERFTPFSSGRTAVFRGADGTFIFADYAAGEALQYADREAVEGARAWMLRARVRMPVGWRGCTQAPGSEELFCHAGGAVQRFDGALNRLPAGGARAHATKEALASRVEWDPAGREWVLAGLTIPGDTLLFRFRPARRMIEPGPGLPPSP